jgi:hypothetical protein
MLNHMMLRPQYTEAMAVTKYEIRTCEEELIHG